MVCCKLMLITPLGEAQIIYLLFDVVRCKSVDAAAFTCLHAPEAHSGTWQFIILSS
jgi:hypothetical protein